MKKPLSCLLIFTAVQLAVHSIQPAAQAQSVDASLQVPATNEGLPGAGPIQRADWFTRVWNERRTAWAEQVAEDQGAVVFLGDSITQGWGKDMRGSFGDLKVANRGISGDTTRGVLIRLQADVIALNPSAVVLLIGTNDLESETDPEVIASNLKLILAALKEHNPQMPIVLCRVFPSSKQKRRSADNIQRINELYAAAVKGDGQVTLVDTWTLFANAQGDAKLDEFPDLLHPNAAGYAKWAAAIQPILETLGLIETEPDVFVLEPGFRVLFNGKNLTGWGYRPTTEEEKKSARNWQARDPNAAEWPFVSEAVDFDGKVASADGRYVAKNGRLIVTTPVEGRKIQKIWTLEEFSSDFVLKLEFRATPNADSGVYVRGPQLQCRDYLLAGPYKELEQYKPQDWNEIVVTVTNNVAHATCNGEVLEAAMKIPETGPIGLEGDRGQMEYRRIRIQELTWTGVPAPPIR